MKNYAKRTEWNKRNFYLEQPHKKKIEQQMDFCVFKCVVRLPLEVRSFLRAFNFLKRSKKNQQVWNCFFLKCVFFFLLETERERERKKRLEGAKKMWGWFLLSDDSILLRFIYDKIFMARNFRSHNKKHNENV